MCNDWFNIRFGFYHLRIGPSSGISWKFNPAQKDWFTYEPHTWKFFAVYKFFGRHNQ